MEDKKLFTPGPLNTSPGVKEAMLTDLGSRDFDFIALVKNIRQRLLHLANLKEGEYEAVIMQGSGTFGLESVINSTISKNDEVLVVINGAYGRRIAQMVEVQGLPLHVLIFEENEIPSVERIEEELKAHPNIKMVVATHCETTTGIMNPIEEIGEMVGKHNKLFFVDAMSSFGAVPLDFKKADIDYLVSSSNKCIQGVPGFSFVIAKTASLEATKGLSRTLSFDLYAQWQGLEKNGQFRFTPPTHTLIAFSKALDELAEEGGVEGRAARYQANNKRMLDGMFERGFKAYVAEENRGYIITSFYYPEHPNFSFETFYAKLNERDQVIYPGKLTHTDCFRIGNIGHLFENDMDVLLNAVDEVLNEMQVEMPDSIHN